MILTKVPLPPETYYHRFMREDGSVFEVETTQKEYEALALPDPQNPAHPEGTWFQSYKGYHLEPGTYADEKGTQVLVNMDGDTVPLKNEYMNGDILTTSGTTEITRIKSL